MIPLFTSYYYRGGGSSAPASVLQPWYDSLAVKPSAGLWADLQVMADGMNTDGDWGEMDFLSMIACMETEEQRLKPLKTSSNESAVKVGTPTLDASGAFNPVPGDLNYLDSKWNPADNGIKYTLNSAFIGVYGDTVTSVTSALPIVGSFEETLGLRYYGEIDTNSTTTSMRISGLSAINQDTQISAISKAGLLNSTKRFFASLKRTSSTSISRFINGTTTVQTISSSNLPRNDFFILGLNNVSSGVSADTSAIARTVICGSGLINESNVVSRLHTFFAARGLSISNY